jgi:hypothetical protein
MMQSRWGCGARCKSLVRKHSEATTLTMQTLSAYDRVIAQVRMDQEKSKPLVGKPYLSGPGVWPFVCFFN